MSELLIVFVWLVVAAVCIYFAFYALSRAPMPEPIRMPVTLLVTGFVVVVSLFAFVAALQRAGLLGTL